MRFDPVWLYFRGKEAVDVVWSFVIGAFLLYLLLRVVLSVPLLFYLWIVGLWLLVVVIAHVEAWVKRVNAAVEKIESLEED